MRQHEHPPRPASATVPASAPAPAQAPTFVDTLGPGEALDEQARLRMETAFGADFSEVQVHAGAEAGQAARRLSAQALTVGDHIAFAPGNYRPGTPVGDAMLAHELAHTIQQGEAPGTDAGAPVVEPAGSSLEGDAETAAASAMRKMWNRAGTPTTTAFQSARPALRAGLRVQRCGWSSVHPAADRSIGFQSCGFTHSGDSSRLLSEDHTTFVAVGTEPYFASGDVQSVGAPDEVARRWEAGFLQTLFHDHQIAHYGRPEDAVPSTVFSQPGGAHRDAVDGSREPWYNSKKNESLSGNDSKVHVGMWDQPTRPPRWTKQGAPLVSMEGTSDFCSWLVVRHAASGEIIPLNWDSWEVNWDSKFRGRDHEPRWGQQTGVRITGDGEGQGPRQPVLTGNTANQDGIMDENGPPG